MLTFQSSINSIKEYWVNTFPKEIKDPNDYVLIEIPYKQRRSDFLIKAGILIFAFLMILIFLYEETHDLGAIIISVVLIGPIFGFMFYGSYKSAKTTHIEVLTPEGKRKKQEEEEARLSSTQVNEDEFGFSSAWYVRYPLAVTCLVLSVFLSDYAQGLEDDKFALAVWLWVGILGIGSLIYAREISLFLLGALLLFGLFKGIAALPVSVAIIIGALVIANAMRKR